MGSAIRMLAHLVSQLSSAELDRYSNYTNMTTYDETGENDYMYLFNEIEEAYLAYEQEAGFVITDNLLDTSVRGMMRDAGWNQDRDSHKAVIDWF